MDCPKRKNDNNNKRKREEAHVTQEVKEDDKKQKKEDPPMTKSISFLKVFFIGGPICGIQERMIHRWDQMSKKGYTNRGELSNKVVMIKA